MKESNFSIPQSWQNVANKLGDTYSQFYNQSHDLVRSAHPERYADVLPLILVAGFLGFMSLNDRRKRRESMDEPAPESPESDSDLSEDDSHVYLYSRYHLYPESPVPPFSLDTVVPSSEYGFLVNEDLDQS